MSRDSRLQDFIDLASSSIRVRADGPSAAAASRVFSRLAERTGERLQLPAERLPVCSHFDAIRTAMEAEGPAMAALARAFFALEPDLLWMRRKGSNTQNEQFHDGHANAMLIGPGGLEQRDDVWAGVTVLAPHVRYIDHSHPPEEVYLAFTRGEWWNSGMDWTEPGPGGLIYNPPAILHAMRSGAQPMLALWILPVD